MLWMDFLNQENIRAVILTIAKIRFPLNSQNMFLLPPPLNCESGSSEDSLVQVLWSL